MYCKKYKKYLFFNKIYKIKCKYVFNYNDIIRIYNVSRRWDISYSDAFDLVYNFEKQQTRYEIVYPIKRSHSLNHII
jgi:hypothetical protein